MQNESTPCWYNRFIVQIGCCIASAVLFTFSFPPYGWWPLILPSLVLLLTATSRTSSRRAFYLGLFQAFTAYALTLRWFYLLFASAAFAFWLLMALFVALFCLLNNLTFKHCRIVGATLILTPVLWTGIEFFRSEIFTLRFPWLSIGSSIGPVWLSPIIGTYGVSFIVVLAASAFIHRRTLLIAALLFVLVLGSGFFRPGRIEPGPPEERVRIALVQNEEGFLPLYLTLSKSIPNSDIDLFIWPEYSLPYDVRATPSAYAALTNFCADFNTELVCGTKTVTGPGLKDWHNTALTVDRQGVIHEYYKARPVHFMNDGTPGNTFQPARSDIGAFGTPICFDSDYTDITRHLVRNGSEFLAIPSSDLKSWSLRQHLQHAEFFRLRAIENHRWLACAASSGVSQIIDPHGNVHTNIPAMVSGVAVGTVTRCQDLTIFTRFGWLFPWLALFATVGWALRLGCAKILPF